VKESMQSAQEWANLKFYVDKNQSPKKCEINDKMFLKVKLLRIGLRSGKCQQISL